MHGFYILRRCAIVHIGHFFFYRETRGKKSTALCTTVPNQELLYSSEKMRIFIFSDPSCTHEMGAKPGSTHHFGCFWHYRPVARRMPSKISLLRCLVDEYCHLWCWVPAVWHENVCTPPPFFILHA